MEALQQIFVLITDRIPKFCANMILYFVWFFFKPYQISRLTMRALRSQNLTSISLLLLSYTAFAITLGIPSSARHVVAFEGGLTSSLGRIWYIDTKGREFYYLFCFVLVASILTIILCEISKTQISKTPLLMITKRRAEFSDLFNIFIAFSIFGFLIVSLIVSIVLTELHFDLEKLSLTIRLRELLVNHDIPDITGILLQPALIFLFLPLIGLADKLFNKWAGRRSFYKLLSDKTSGQVVSEIVMRRIDVLPGLSFVMLVVTSSLLLAFMADAIFDQVEGAKKISIEASCHTKSDKLDKLFVSAIFENHTSRAYPIKTLFLVIDDNLVGRQHRTVELRIEPANLAWMSEKGLYLEAGEKRYYRLLLTLPEPLRLPAASRLTCEQRNDGKGEFDGLDGERDKFQAPLKVDGDAFSPKASLG